MKYEYEGIEEFEGYILECNIPKNEWGFGTKVEINLYQPERLSEKDQQPGNSGKLICDSPNTPTKGSETSRND
jgi:hypothetical protein